MKLNDPLPATVGWITRLIVWSIGAVIIYAIVVGYSFFKLTTDTTDCMEQRPPQPGTGVANSQQLLACIDQKAGPIERFLMRSPKRIIAALPNTPCQYLGMWDATRGAMVYRVDLTDNSQFVATPERNAPPAAQIVTGSWGVVGKNMVWLYDEGHVWPPDVNPIGDASVDAFTLTEENGSTTRYTRVASTHSQSCRGRIGNLEAPTVH